LNPILLGNEAVALGALHAGITAAYGYPGTPSTEIIESLLERNHEAIVSWCANEKTAYEAALGVTFVGRRALVTMKHVGLNVAADPFMSSAIVAPHAGLVLAVADDPGMHSSQNEQDSRFYADFARIPCLEPADPQQAYDMTRDAFDLSERFRVPVMLRLVTRVSHARGTVRTAEKRGPKALEKAPRASSWILMPMNARRQWHEHLERQKDLEGFSESSPYNWLEPAAGHGEVGDRLGIITTGIARDYFLESLDDLTHLLGYSPAHLHVGAYPLPREKIRSLASQVGKIVVFEEGHSFLERRLRGILPLEHEILGKESGHVPLEGELTPDLIRQTLELPLTRSASLEAVFPGLRLPGRPPQLCSGCPHGDTYDALKPILASFEAKLVTSDIGCYSLGALPPHSVTESCVCMGASIGMARGAVDAGFRPVVAVIGDSTFVHSGIPPLLEAAAANTPMTVLILDNETVAMTGGQQTLVPTSRLTGIVLGLGVQPDHLRVITAHPKHAEENTAIMRAEVDHPGLSVVIAVRECVEAAKRRKDHPARS